MKEQDYSNALTIPEDFQKKYLFNLFLEIINSCLDMSSASVSFHSPYVELNNMADKRIFKKIGSKENGKHRKIFTKQCIRDIINLSYANNKIEKLYDILIDSRIFVELSPKNNINFNTYKLCDFLPKCNPNTNKYELNNENSSDCIKKLQSNNCKENINCPIKEIYKNLLNIDNQNIFSILSSISYISAIISSYEKAYIYDYANVAETYIDTICFESKILYNSIDINEAIELLKSCYNIIKSTNSSPIKDEQLAYIYLYYNQLIHWPILRNIVRRSGYKCDDIFIFHKILNPASFIIRNCYKENPCDENLSLFTKIEQARIVSFLNAVRQTPFDNYYNNIYLSDIITTDMELIQNHKEKTLSLYIELINLLRYSPALIDIDVNMEEQKIENLLTEYHSDDEAYFRYYLYKYMFGYNDTKIILRKKFWDIYEKVKSGQSCTTDSFLTLFYLFDTLGGLIEVNRSGNSCDMLLYLATENTRHDPLLELSSPMSYIRVYGDKILAKYYESFYCNAIEILNKIDSPLEKKNQ